MAFFVIITTSTASGHRFFIFSKFVLSKTLCVTTYGYWYDRKIKFYIQKPLLFCHLNLFKNVSCVIILNCRYFRFNCSTII